MLGDLWQSHSHPSNQTRTTLPLQFPCAPSQTIPIFPSPLQRQPLLWFLLTFNCPIPIDKFYLFLDFIWREPCLLLYPTSFIQHYGSRGSSLWLCEPVVRSSLLLSSIPTCEYRTDHFSIGALAIPASAIVTHTMNVPVQVFVRTHIFFPCRWIPESGIARSWGRFMLNLTRQTVLQNICTIKQSHQQWMRVLVVPRPHQHLPLSVLLILAVLVSMKWWWSQPFSAPDKKSHILCH